MKKTEVTVVFVAARAVSIVSRWVAGALFMSMAAVVLGVCRA